MFRMLTITKALFICVFFNLDATAILPEESQGVKENEGTERRVQQPLPSRRETGSYTGLSLRSEPGRSARARRLSAAVHYRPRSASSIGSRLGFGVRLGSGRKKTEDLTPFAESSACAEPFASVRVYASENEGHVKRVWRLLPSQGQPRAGHRCFPWAESVRAALKCVSSGLAGYRPPISSCGHFPLESRAQKRQLRPALAKAKTGHLHRFGQN